MGGAVLRMVLESVLRLSLFSRLVELCLVSDKGIQLFFQEGVIILPSVKTKIPENPDPEYPWVNEEMETWFRDMEKLEGYKEILEYFSDLLTDNELRMIAQRWYIARELVKTEDSNVDIAERVGASPNTVSAVAKSVYLGVGGMESLLKKSVISAEERKRLEKMKKAMKKKRGGSYSYVKGYFR